MITLIKENLNKIKDLITKDGRGKYLFDILLELIFFILGNWK